MNPYLFSRRPSSKRGMALVSVLAVLVLLTLLIVAFVARTTTARAAASSYHATASTRLLADTAVNLVQAQINEATTLGMSGGPATYTWGSQPGAIRVFDATGALNSIYRLYSATPDAGDGGPSSVRMASGGNPLKALSDDLPGAASWTTYGAQWADLNSAVKDSQGKYHFPILDPRDPAADPTANPTSVATLWQPAGGGTPLKGFSVNAPAVVGTGVNPAPMPVRWLYVLKDGSIVSPDNPDTASNTLTFNNAVNSTGAADVPTATNPIVGRIAYWTDDESSKIDINTAGGDDVVRGTNAFAANSIFWATPAFCTPDDVLLANYQPSNGEFQRYSGHPGTVGLNTTLSTLAGLSVPLGYNDFYSILPRYGPGGTTSATVPSPKTGGTASTISLVGNRLYTSVGEMLFNVNRTKSALATDVGSETAAAAAVERSNFFLTAHSSSSELNLFGEPRVSIWPVSNYNDSSHRTATDQLLAFDSTVSRTTAGTADQFYFQRKDPTSTLTDCGISTNISLFNYLDYLTTHSIPGFGSSFTSDKYSGMGMHQILSEIFDYVRTTNVTDPVLIANSTYGSASLSYGQNWGNSTASVSPDAGGSRSGSGGVQVVPSTNGVNGVNGWGTQGIAAFPVPMEVTIDFVALGQGQRPAYTDPTTHLMHALVAEKPIPYQQWSYNKTLLVGDTDSTAGAYDNIVDDTLANGAQSAYKNSPPPYYGKPADKTTAVQAFVYVSFLNPSLIASRIQPAFCFSITGLNNLSVQGYTDAGHLQAAIPLHFPGSVANTVPGGAAGLSNDEQMCVVDNSDGAGFINGYIGNWAFGYIPFSGETGNDNYGSSAGFLAPNPAVSSTTWSIYRTVATTSGAGTLTGRLFPFYSQIFGLPGQNGYAQNTVNTSLGNPNASNVFKFNGGSLTIKMYDAHKDGQQLYKTDLISTYNVTFPSSNSGPPPNSSPLLSLPNYYPTDSQIVGTLGNGGDPGNPSAAPYDRWHYAVDGTDSGNSYYQIHISPNDTIQSMVLSPQWSDARDLCLRTVPSGAFTPHPLYGSSSQAHDLLTDAQEPFAGNFDPTNWGRLVTENPGSSPSYLPTTTTPGVRVYGYSYPTVPPRVGTSAGKGAYTSLGAPGDWDNGLGIQPDGPWVNMADEGALPNQAAGGQPNFTSYYDSGNAGQKFGIASTFSPNRMMPSPAMFGSLPTGVDPTNPKAWQTLLFRPGSGAGGFGQPHPGEKNQPSNGDPADHLLLDLFWMPQAEPYPISQPFVTEGKINLNYEIQPFTYITRDTALRALLASEEIAVMPDSLANYYKNGSSQGGLPGVTTGQIKSATGAMDQNGDSRLPVDVDQTLGLNPDQTMDPHAPSSGTSTTTTAQTGTSAWYDSAAKTTRFFRSASELCEMFLVPLGYDWKEFSGATFDSHSWYKIPGGDFALVGDNTRERPYSDLYSRVTTKSNTYTVYYTVQSLKNAQPPTAAGQASWSETTGTVTGEYRGSTTLERYLDPNAIYPDLLASPGTASLEPYYKWRVVSTHQFAP